MTCEMYECPAPSIAPERPAVTDCGGELVSEWPWGGDGGGVGGCAGGESGGRGAVHKGMKQGGSRMRGQECGVKKAGLGASGVRVGC